MEASTLQDIFVGREHEQQLYHDFLTHDTPWVLIITGLGGIGKSTLVEHLAKDTSSSVCTCKLDFNETVLRTEPLIVLQRLAQQIRPHGNAEQFDVFEQAVHRDLDQLEQIRKIKLPPYTSDDANIQEAQLDTLEDDAASKEIGRQMRELATESFYDLLNAFHLNQLVLMLDTCEWLNEPEGWEVGQWVFTELIPELHNRLWHNDQRCSVVIVSRVKPQLGRIDKQDQQYLPLSMLSEKSVYEYLERAGMHDQELRQRVYNITHGHALSVSIISAICQEQGEKSLAEEDFPFLQKEFTEKASMEFIDERILDRLKSPYRELTRYGVLLRSFNLPLLQAVFFDMDAIKGPDAPNIFDHLIRYPFIESRGNYNYAFHELLREVIAEKVQQQEGPEKEQWKNYHKHALEYFKGLAPYSPDWYYHAIASDEWQGIKDWLQAIQKARAPQMQALLQLTYDSALKLSPAAGAVRDYEQGRFNYVSIEWLDATENVQQAREKRKEALKGFENALKNFKEAQDSCGEALSQVAIDALQGTRKVQAAELKSYWLACLSPNRNPYKGLRPFTVNDARDYFGHDLLVNELMTTLQEELTADKKGLLVVVGPSGSGKSSVIMAGLLPQLQTGALPRSKQWVYLEPMLPGQHPLESLALTLAPLLPERGLKSIREDLESDSASSLHLLASTLTRDSMAKVVLFVDQFEEVFTLTIDEAERRHFFELLVTAVTEPSGPLFVILTLRADFYDRPMQYPELFRLIDNHHVSVLPLERDELRRVIEQPANLPEVQLTFESGLVDELLLDMQGQSAALPLLEFTLDQLFQRRNGRQLTLQAYHEVGGVTGALAKHAEETYQALPSDAHRQAARDIFLRLIEPGTTEQDTTRRRADRSEFERADPKQAQQMQETLEAFISARLLTTNQVGSKTTVEVSHEALIREWKRLAEWLHEARDDIGFQQSLSENVVEWEQRKRPRDRLYRGAQLKEAQKWARRNMPSEQEAAFLRASAAQRTLSLVGLIVVVLLLASSLGFVSWYVFAQPNPTLVTTFQDNGVGSLRWCINNAPSGSTIRFAQDLRGLIELTGGDLVFVGGKMLTIIGPGANQLMISGGNTGAIIRVSKGAILNISGLSFKNSETRIDAFLFNEGTLTVTNSVISGNKTTASGISFGGTSFGGTSFGGGIENRGTLTVTNNTIISNNSVSSTGVNEGGGIYNSGKFTLVNSIISHNEATGSGGDGFGVGGGIFNDSTGAINVTSSVISDNKTSSASGPLLNAGGGIENREGGTLTVTNSTFSGNLVTGNPVAYGGGISNESELTVTHSTFLNNTANSSSDSGFGGGINNGGTLMVTDSTFSGNLASGKQASSGGGIRNEVKGKLSVTESTFSNNSANSSDSLGFGGGIDNGGTLMVTDSTFSGNSASGKQSGTGGGIANTGKLTVTESTFSNNSANGSGGGIISGAKGSSALIRFSTIYGNKSNAGGGIWVDPTGSSQMTIGGSVIAANSALSGPDISGAVISGGYNLIENTAGATGLNASVDRQVTLADLKIDSTLRDNGGSTKALALLPGSPAIDAVPLQACSITISDISGHNVTITTDQRGNPRPDGSENACDVGAYESSY